MRAVLALAGAAALAWGGWLALRFALTGRDSWQALFWFAGGPVLHDALVAPAVGLAGLALTRFVPRRWRTPVAVGAALSGVLVLLAVPLLWRPYGVPTNPGLHDADYPLRLALALGVVWLGVISTGTVQTVRHRRERSRPR